MPITLPLATLVADTLVLDAPRTRLAQAFTEWALSGGLGTKPMPDLQVTIDARLYVGPPMGTGTDTMGAFRLLVVDAKAPGGVAVNGKWEVVQAYGDVWRESAVESWLHALACSLLTLQAFAAHIGDTPLSSVSLGDAKVWLADRPVTKMNTAAKKAVTAFLGTAPEACGIAGLAQGVADIRRSASRSRPPRGRGLSLEA